jgi:hypothetical protein
VQVHFSLFGDSADVTARYVHGLRQTYLRLRNHFGCNRWYSLVTRLKRKLVSVHLEIMLVSVQDRCTVCIECTIAHKSFGMHPMELLDDVRHVESCFGLFRDSVIVGARLVHDLHQTYHRLRKHFQSNP